MNNREEIVCSYNTILEMLEDRNYIVPNELKNLPINIHNHKYNNNTYDFEVSNNNNNKCYVMFFINPNLTYKINSIREKIDSKNVNKEDEIIIIIKVFNNTIKKLEKEYNCSIFYYKQLIRNITKHKLVPKHELVKKENENEILKTYNIKNKLQLNQIIQTDPICKYYNFKSGNIIKITRICISSGDTIAYRTVK
tara:strand:+ start:495 stop:1079 length:585 start_codon:yes stop_codon:yes gene_type:complete